MSQKNQLLEAEIARLDKKYNHSLSRQDMANEMNIHLSTLDRRIKNATDIPNYKRHATGAISFPITSVAYYFTSQLIQTA